MNGAPVESDPVYPLLRWGVRTAAGAVLLISILNWVGWATGTDLLTRAFRPPPQMPPWTAVLQGMLVWRSSFFRRDCHRCGSSSDGLWLWQPALLRWCSWY